ncbi:MAG: ribokinase [Clostridiales bacterium]|nr:ribokinase [Clostridiales bacterium]
MRSICVIGSLNVDLTVTLPRFHQPGETISGSDFHTYAGGKGGNQAVAAARLGVPTRFVGKLGDDENGAFYLRTLKQEGVDVAGIQVLPGVPSGVALIEVDSQGENRIAIVAGANGQVDQQHIAAALPKVPADAVCLLQLEIPMPSVVYAATACRARGGLVILDPAPAVPLEDGLLQQVDYLTPNEGELGLLTGMPTQSDAQVEAAARCLLQRGVGAVVAKLGGRGCLYVDGQTTLKVPGFKVQVVDTTAAGDSFNAGLAAALARDMAIEKALCFANAVGALSVTGAGAQGAMPRYEQALQLMEQGAS